MKSSRPKVPRTVRAPADFYVWMLLRAAGAEDVVLVINPDMKAVHELFQDTVKYAYQEEQLGTGHAVQVARMLWMRGQVRFFLCGDTPLCPENCSKTW